MKPALQIAVVLLGGMIGLCGLAQTTETHSFLSLNRPIPDGNASGLSDRRVVNSAIAEITALRVKLRIAGEFNGDNYAYLRQVTGGNTNFCVLLNRVGRANAAVCGYPDAGLDVTFDDNAANGNIHTYRSITAAPLATPLTGVWQPDGRAVDPAVVLDTSAVTTTLGFFSGSNPNAEWTLYIADVDSGGTNTLVSWQLEIVGPAVPDLVWPAPDAITYGTPLGSAQLNASSPVPGSYAYDPPSGTVLNAGTAQVLSVLFTPDDPESHVPVVRTVTIDVAPAPLAITAIVQTKVYGTADPTLTYNVGGLQGDDTETAVLSGSLSREPGETVAGSPYAITRGSLTATANYAIQFTGNVLSITPASTTATIESSANPATPGESVTFTVQVTAVDPKAGIPTGLVQFKIDGADAGPPAALSSGIATHSSTTLTAGYRTVSAEYAGDGNFVGATCALESAQLVNSMPVAVDDVVEREPASGAKVLIETLLSNDSDADAGDSIAFVSVSPTSLHGGTVTQSNDWIHYIPAPGFTNADSFTYTIVDTYGSQAEAVVTVEIKIDTVPSPNLTLLDLGDGSYMLKFDGIPGRTYRIEMTEDLSQAAWQILGSATGDAAGMFEFTDTPPAGAPERFYRSVYP
jgi:subtilisin-like proprotein convertase family protein